jgi:hypothetical protein
MKNYSDKFIRPLHEVKNEFLQILLSNFFLTIDGSKITCEINFSDKTPCIWTN